MITFSNPRLRAEFADWPSGGKRVRCVFQVHHDKHGWRVSRTTSNPKSIKADNSRASFWCKPKYMAYGGQACIVDGSDGKTYILQVALPWGFIIVSNSSFHDAFDAVPGGASVFEEAQPELHKELLGLIVRGGAMAQAMAGATP